MNRDPNGAREPAGQRSGGRLTQAAERTALGQERPSRPRGRGGENRC